MEKRKVLVVEDEFSINDTLKFSLTKENFIVETAYDGEGAIKLVDEFKPELVLLDVMLPDISGFELCKIFSKKCFVIMLTARDDIIDKILGMEIGADDYITKPFEIREVIARINAIFRRANKNLFIKADTENKRENNKEEIRIDFDKRTVFKGDKEIFLKRKEFDLLSYLYKNKGVVLSREKLLTEVWGYDYYGDTRTVDVHIRRLRANLGEDKEHSVIDTVFGVGYVMR